MNESQEFWLDGDASGGLDAAADPGTQEFWLDGSPATFLSTGFTPPAFVGGSNLIFFW